MASLISSSLDLLRRQKTKKQPHLHARWGDVQISVPTEGAWTQFKNPHKRESMEYGPGFVPGLDTLTKIQDENDDDDYPPEYVEKITVADEQLETTSLTRSSTSSSFSTSSSSVEPSPNLSTISGTFNPTRVPQVLSPSNSIQSTLDGKKKSIPEAKKLDSPSSQVSTVSSFEYKPVRPNYARELAQKVQQERAPRFRYVPASENFRREMEEILPSRSSSQASFHRRSPDEDHLTLSPHIRSRSCEPVEYDPWDPRRRALQPTGVQEVARGRARASSMKTSKQPHFPATQIPAVIEEEEHQPRGRQRTKDRSSSRRAPSLPTSKVASVAKRSRSAVQVQPRMLMTTRMVSEEDDLW